jgi:hypothetical protein
MRTILAVVVVFLSSMSALATSYAAGDSGFLSYSNGSGQWTPRIPGLSHYYGNPHLFPATFNTANLTVMCTPTCAIGNSFSIDLSMSNFTIISSPPYTGTILVGTLNLITKPIILKAQNGIALAHFTLTGNLEACTDLTCSGELFSLSVNIHGPVTIAYNLNSGQNDRVVGPICTTRTLHHNSSGYGTGSCDGKTSSGPHEVAR